MGPAGVNEAEPGESREARNTGQALPGRGPEEDPRSVSSMGCSRGTTRKASDPEVPSRGLSGCRNGSRIGGALDIEINQHPVVSRTVLILFQ